MSERYILKDRKPIHEPDLIAWGAWMQTADRIVAKTDTPDGKISTVFLGLNYQFAGHGKPLIFETMVFGGAMDQYCERSSTWEEAEAVHQRITQKVQEKP